MVRLLDTIWLVVGLPRQDYEFFIYSLNGTTDETTSKFAALC